MSETTDLVLPVLKKIQEELATLRADVADVRETVRRSERKLDDHQTYLTFALGNLTRQEIDLQEFGAWKETVDARLKELGLPPS